MSTTAATTTTNDWTAGGTAATAGSVTLFRVFLSEMIKAP